ncbi:hypothetical protein ABE527_21460 [Brucella sp. TWI432]
MAKTLVIRNCQIVALSDVAAFRLFYLRQILASLLRLRLALMKKPSPFIKRIPSATQPHGIPVVRERLRKLIDKLIAQLNYRTRSSI